MLRRVTVHRAVSPPIAPYRGLLFAQYRCPSRRIAAHCVRANARVGCGARLRDRINPSPSTGLRGRASATRLPESKRHPSRRSPRLPPRAGSEQVTASEPEGSDVEAPGRGARAGGPAERTTAKFGVETRSPRAAGRPWSTLRRSKLRRRSSYHCTAADHFATAVTVPS